MTLAKHSIVMGDIWRSLALIRLESASARSDRVLRPSPKCSSARYLSSTASSSRRKPVDFFLTDLSESLLLNCLSKNTSSPRSGSDRGQTSAEHNLGSCAIRPQRKSFLRAAHYMVICTASVAIRVVQCLLLISNRQHVAILRRAAN